MRVFQENGLRLGVPMLAAALVLLGLALGPTGPRLTRADNRAEAGGAEARGAEVSRQVTVFAVRGAPADAKARAKTSASLASVSEQLRRFLPGHDFRLLDAESGRVLAGESVSCDLGHGYRAKTTLVQPLDEDGKVQLRCELFLGDALQFSAKVKAPLNQLFFYQRPFLSDGSKLLIGVGVR